jgi:hypothetical protein
MYGETFNMMMPQIPRKPIEQQLRSTIRILAYEGKSLVEEVQRA